jgi:hypothetical protein
MTLAQEKRHADLMRRFGGDMHYWTGYLTGLEGRSEHHDALLAGIGSPDLERTRRGRGYRDGLERRGAA